MDALKETPMTTLPIGYLMLVLGAGAQGARSAVVAALLGEASCLPAQATQPTPFDPFPGGSAARYHFDLARNFFSSPEDELASREKLRPRLDHLEQISRSLPQSASGILD